MVIMLRSPSVFCQQPFSQFAHVLHAAGMGLLRWRACAHYPGRHAIAALTNSVATGAQSELP